MNERQIDILLVEDNQDDVELTLHALRKENLANHIQVARDGEEALEFLFCNGAHADRPSDRPPKLVLLDLKLPKVDGMEVLKRLKADPRTRTIPVVILTSSKEERDLVRLWSGSEQLYPEAGRLRAVPGNSKERGLLLAPDQPGPGAKSSHPVCRALVAAGWWVPSRGTLG